MIALTPTYSRRRQGSAHRLPARAVAERARCQERAAVSPVHRRRSGAPILSGQAIGGAALCGEPCTGGAPVGRDAEHGHGGVIAMPADAADDRPRAGRHFVCGGAWSVGHAGLCPG